MEAIAQLIPFILILVLMWLVFIRPMRKRQREFQSTQEALAVGSRVMIAAGIYGDVVTLDDQTLQLRVAAGTVVEVDRGAVRTVLPQNSDASESGEGSTTDSSAES